MNRPSYIQVVAGVIYNPEGKVLLAKRREDDYPPGAWEFPGGKLEKDEDISGALVREIREEFHLELASMHLLQEFDHYDDYKKRFIHFYLVKAQAQNLENFNMRIHSDYAWVEPSGLVKYELATADCEMLQYLEQAEFI